MKRAYKLFRNRVNRTLKKSKIASHNSYFLTHSNNIKKTWQGIRYLINTKNNSNQGISQLNVNGSIINDPKLIANHVNDFFVNVGPNLDKSIPKIKNISPDKFLKNRQDNEFLLSNVTSQEVLDIIQGLESKSLGPASIPINMLKSVADLIIIPLCSLINNSFLTGTFPNALKVAKVIPLHRGEGFHARSE